MDELISRKAVLEFFNDYHYATFTAERLKEYIKELPTIPQTNTAEFEECDNPCIECGGNCCPDEDNDGNIHCKCAKVYFRKEPHTNTAEWKIENNGGTTMWYECSACGNAGDKWDKYCKHCGRKMTNAVAE